MNHDLISVIVPVCNSERYLQCCVDSILAQTYENLEVILVDDGSPDSCPKLCEEYAQGDSRIKVIHQTNAGQAAARNAGLDSAGGAYIAFVDSDDYICPEFLSKLYSALTKENADIAACDYFRVDDRNVESMEDHGIKSDMTVEEYGYWELVNDESLMVFTSLCNKLYKAEFWARERVDKKPFAEDASTLLRIIAMAKRIRIIKDKLYCYRLNDNGLTKRYTVKNLTGVEVHLERCEYYFAHGMEELVKTTLIMCANRLHYARLHLDLRREENQKKYCELLERLKGIYRRTPHKFDLSKPWLCCTLFCLSDDLYEFAYQAKRNIQKYFSA